MGYEEALRRVRRATEQLAKQHITVGPLNDAIDELEQHANDVVAVEAEIDAIRREILAPITKELNENRRAGTFSILGFWVGLISMGLSIVALASVLWAGSETPVLSFPPVTTPERHVVSTEEQKCCTPGGVPTSGPLATPAALATLNEIAMRVSGITDTYVPVPGEIMAKESQREPLLTSTDGIIRIEVSGTDEFEYGDSVLPVAGVYLYLGDRRIGSQAATQMVKVKRGSASREFLRTAFSMPILVPPIHGDIWFAEGEEIEVMDKYRYLVPRIFRMRSQMLRVADSFNGVLLRPIEQAPSNTAPSKVLDAFP